MPVIGRFAQADDHRNMALDFQRPGMLLRYRLIEVRQFGRESIRAFESIRQINMYSFLRQCGSFVEQSPADSQFGNRIRPGHQLKTMEVLGQYRGLSRYGSFTLAFLNPAQGMFDDPDQIGPRPDRRVERNDTGIGKPHRFSEAVNKQMIDQADLGADHFDGRIIGPCVFPQLSVIDREKVS